MSKELKFTKGYNQEELDAWWKMVGYPGQAPRIPDYLIGKVVTNYRNLPRVRDLSGPGTETMGLREVDELYGAGSAKAALDFKNQLGKFSDPFREQSGASKVTGKVLGLASVFLPPLAAINAFAKAGNDALKDPQKELQEALEENAQGDTNGAAGGAGVLPVAAFNRERTPGPLNYLRYGMGPEHTFFLGDLGDLEDEAPVPVGVAPPPRALAAGGVLNDVARQVRAAGRDGDSVLVHVNPNELAAMDEAWGQHTINPDTGLPQHGFFSKLKKALTFDFDMGKKIVKAVKKNPERLLFGIDPLGTKIGNKVTKNDLTPLVNTMGGPTDEAMAAYEAKHGEGSLGYAPGMHKAAGYIASMYGARGLGKLASAGAASLGTGTAVGRAAGALAKVISNPKVATALTQAGRAALDGPPGGGVGVGGPSAIGDGSSLPLHVAGRKRMGDPSRFTRYGMGPEHSFYAQNDTPVAMGGGGALSMLGHYPLRPKQRPSQGLLNFAGPPGARGDPRIRAAVGDEAPLSQFVSKGTGAGGREDNIDAKLSENEYVIDAETVALLGDGSPEAGAKKLDAMRKQIRRHKGQALAKGKISPDAKQGALQYLAEGGKAGAIRALFKRKPKPDPNANLRRIKQTLDDALSRKREGITPLEMTEHFERHYAARKARMAQEAGAVSDEGALQLLTGKEGK